MPGFARGADTSRAWCGRLPAAVISAASIAAVQRAAQRSGRQRRSLSGVATFHQYPSRLHGHRREQRRVGLLVDQHNTFGLGDDVPMSGNLNDGIIAYANDAWSHCASRIRWFLRQVIRRPHRRSESGLKGRGLWAANGDRTPGDRRRQRHEAAGAHSSCARSARQMTLLSKPIARHVGSDAALKEAADFDRRLLRRSIPKKILDHRLMKIAAELTARRAGHDATDRRAICRRILVELDDEESRSDSRPMSRKRARYSRPCRTIKEIRADAASWVSAR